MLKFAVETIGCRLNQYDTEKIASDLKKQGMQRVDFRQKADLYVINTCTVTSRADSSCRNIISRASRQENAIVVVVGCYVNSDPQKVAGLKGVDLIIKNSDKNNITEILREKFPRLFCFRESNQTFDLVVDFHNHNRFWLKIGDGCNQHCAYCIIPSVRGNLVNRPIDEIIGETNLVTKNGYHEIVLTGIHIGKYSYGNIKSPAELIRYILNKTNISRIRLSSIEPQEVDSELIQAMAEGGRRICRHFHIPLQSGSDRILKIMKRPYNSERYLEIITAIRKQIRGVIIGADIIVGFPGESDDDFRQSVRIAELGLLDYLHVFSYSDRPGTEATSIPNKIKPDIIKKRNKILRDISSKHYAMALKKEIGQTATVISEYMNNKDGKSHRGITDNYLKMLIPAGFGGNREILKIRVIGATDSYLTGQMM